ncbi:hypothetical protein OF83DRAFT_363453 [Amylostereum chailletii]|nr:hypothetical protein OF83DRAFT_363453 [Amylostereum chailletii]
MPALNLANSGSKLVLQETLVTPHESTSAWVSTGRQRLSFVKDIAETGRASAQLLNELDDEITQVSSLLQDLKIQRNACRPFLRLPPEIMAIIVTLVASVDPAIRFTDDRANPSALGWINITHVCQRLRNVALNMSFLWARLVSYFPAARETILERARDLPVVLLVGRRRGAGRYRESPELSSFAASHAKRARSLCVIQEEFAEKLKRAVVGQSLPDLQRLVLSSDMTYCPFKAPPLVAPNLHTISLDNMFIPWMSSKLRSLYISMSFRPSPICEAVFPTCRRSSGVATIAPSRFQRLARSTSRAHWKTAFHYGGVFLSLRRVYASVSA